MRIKIDTKLDLDDFEIENHEITSYLENNPTIRDEVLEELGATLEPVKKILTLNEILGQVEALDLENSTKLLILLHGMIARKVGVRP